MDPAAELSALATALDELTARVAAGAEQAQRDNAEELAGNLYEVERSLRSAGRRLGAVLRRFVGEPEVRHRA
ncbi:hypothetical protein BH20ACT2_BH20ACT2_24500 [soil metagenome]